MNGSAENGLLVWNGQVGNPACVKERDRDAARPRFPILPDARLGVVDRLLRVDDPRPRTVDVPDAHATALSNRCWTLGSLVLLWAAMSSAAAFCSARSASSSR